MKKTEPKEKKKRNRKDFVKYVKSDRTVKDVLSSQNLNEYIKETQMAKPRKPNGCKNCKWDCKKIPVIPKTKRTCPACGAENLMWEPMTEEQIKHSRSTIRKFAGNRKKRK